MNPKLPAWPGVVALAVLSLTWGCGGDSTAPGDAGRHVDGLLVSSPFRAGGPASTVAHSAGGAGSVAYVSMVPGSVPKGATLSVRNLSDGATATASIVDGGADPVAVAAVEGNDLSIIVTDSAGHSTTSTEAVKQRRPPRVVRTQPIRGSVDVPLNVRVTVVFSGPIDPATVDSSAVTLLQSGKPVAGQAVLSADGLSLSWIPSSPLSVATSYVVVLSPTIEDLNGFPVSGFEPVDFMTGAAMESDYGALEIIVRTSGAPIQVVTDPLLPTSGWLLQVGTLPTPYRIGPEDTVTIPRIPAGRYDLAWKVSPNCRAHASTPAQASVAAGSTSHVTAIFTCDAWSARLQVTMNSHGVSVPPEHQLVFRSTGYINVITATVPAIGTAVVPLPDATKQYMVSLTSSNDQCRIVPSSQNVPLQFNGTGAMQFDVTCNTPSVFDAAIEVITRTTGGPATSQLWPLFPTSMGLTREGGMEYVIDLLPNDTLTLQSYATLDYFVGGTHTAKWHYLPPNCAGGDEPAPFQVVEGQVAHVTLTATCAAWDGRLQISTVWTDAPIGGSIVFRIAGAGATIPLTHLWPGGSGTVPLPMGDYDVWIDPELSWCFTNEPEPKHVRVMDANAAVTFNIVCHHD